MNGRGESRLVKITVPAPHPIAARWTLLHVDRKPIRLTWQMDVNSELGVCLGAAVLKVAEIKLPSKVTWLGDPLVVN